MTLSGTSTRYAVWEDMAIAERLSWVECDADHPLVTTIGQLRIAGWSIPPLPVVDQVGEIHDASVTVVASTALGPDEGRQLVDRETFDAKLAEMRERAHRSMLSRGNRSNVSGRSKQAKALAAEAQAQAAKSHDATVVAIDAVDDPTTKAALESIYGAVRDEKEKS